MTGAARPATGKLQKWNKRRKSEERRVAEGSIERADQTRPRHQTEETVESSHYVQ